MLSACNNTNDAVVPHNILYFENRTLDNVYFILSDTNRFKIDDLELGMPMRLINGSFLTLETDMDVTLERYNNGWNELENITSDSNAGPYSIQREEVIHYELTSDNLETELETGRYRLTVDYSLFNNEGEKEHTHSIGAVFWVED